MQFVNESTVELIDSMASDESVIRAARVSTQTDELETGSTNLINFLVRERHGCYSADTEVLTEDGWKFWPDVVESDKFVTLNLKNDTVEVQAPSRLIRNHDHNRLIHVQMKGVDLMVTEDHNMVAARRHSLATAEDQNGWEEYGLHNAKDFHLRPYRLKLDSVGRTGGVEHDSDFPELLGFALADGSFGTSLSFHLKKERKIKYLRDLTGQWTIHRNGDKFNISALSDEQRSVMCQALKDRRIPNEVLSTWSKRSLSKLLEGFIVGDGNVSARGKVTFSTVRQGIIDDFQYLGAMIGQPIIQTKEDSVRSGAFGTRPLLKATLYSKRNSNPRVGWTHEDRWNQVEIKSYDGYVYCATVPNGTLYVRRNGKAIWSGNSPFEHSVFKWRIKAPIFVWREFMRHRVASYNEQSSRYSVMRPEFYIPSRDRTLVQIGKTGNYEFVPGTPEQYEFLIESIKRNNETTYADYQERLDMGIAKEVARMDLPLNLMSTAYVTMNARGLMNFLSLRVKSDDSAYKSYPQWEINDVANKMEDDFASNMPVTHSAFVKNGRVQP